MDKTTEQAPRDKAESREIEELFRTAPFLLVQIGFDGYLKRVNPAWAVLGWSEEELLGKPWASFLIHPDDLERTGQSVAALMSGTTVVEFEQRLMCKDGSWRWFSCSGRPKPEEAMFSGIGFDITERKRAEEEVRRLNAVLAAETTALEATNAELQAFSYSVSHDLRAPLRSIDGFTQAVLKRYADQFPAEANDYLQRVSAASRRMGLLIDGLLSLGRVTREDMRFQELDLSALAQSILTDLHEGEPDRDVELQIQPVVKVRGDARLLRVVLENLLGNAWKFTGKRSRARIEFGTSEDSGETAYFVRDNGAGFDQAYADKLFGAFQRLHRVTEFAGTGIGLATVQRIVHRHGGRVWAEGAVEQGATFYFTLHTPEEARRRAA